MAVLLECSACNQNYTVPKIALGRVTSCPWCGAPSAGPVVDHLSNGVSPPPVVPAVGLSSFVGQVGLIPSALASYGRRPQREAPAVVWLVLGLGLGVSIVLAVLLFAFPQAIGRGNQDVDQPRAEQNDVRIIVVPSTSESAHSPTTVARVVKTASLATGEQRNVELVRQVERERSRSSDDGAKRDDEAGKRMTPGSPRWMSNNPPPIGDPDDDSPGIGLVVREPVVTTKRMNADRRALDDEVTNEEADAAGAMTSKSDSDAAIKALEAAGVKCEKDSETGQVKRIDGSFRMTDELMLHVARLPNVVVLKISFSDVTDEGLAHVKDLSGLRELILNETKVTDSGIEHLDALSDLEKLDLEKTAVSDACIEQLTKLTKLKHIDVRKTTITPAGITELQKVLPGAKVRRK